MAGGRVATVCGAGACLVIACSSTPQGSAGGLPGYIHVLAKSRFALGTIVGTQDVAGMHQILGSEGVFATEIVSQMAVATTNAGVASVMPFPGGASAQNQAVSAYFIGAGVPLDQVASVTALSGFASVVGPSPASPSATVLATWTDSVLCRGYGGVAIPDSFAWATLDADGKSVAESVYWPEIAATTMQATASFEQTLADPERAAEYMSKLPSGVQDGGLAIHHSSGEKTAFTAAPYFDVTLAGAVLHFDPDGSAQQLPGSESPCP